MASGSPPVPDSPLTNEEAAAIDALPWPLLERQRLRLLAHSLRSLQAAAGRSELQSQVAHEILPERTRDQLACARQPSHW